MYFNEKWHMYQGDAPEEGVSRWSMQNAKSRQQASGLASCASQSSFAYFEWPLTPSCTLLNICATLRRGLPFFLAMFSYCTQQYK